MRKPEYDKTIFMIDFSQAFSKSLERKKVLDDTLFGLISSYRRSWRMKSLKI